MFRLEKIADLFDETFPAIDTQWYILSPARSPIAN